MEIPHIVRFLEHIRDVKGEMTRTNMEANVFKGLMCTSTQAELCAMSIFSQLSFIHGCDTHVLASVTCL